MPFQLGPTYGSAYLTRACPLPRPLMSVIAWYLVPFTATNANEPLNSRPGNIETQHTE